jgi:hypothetical protein
MKITGRATSGERFGKRLGDSSVAFTPRNTSEFPFLPTLGIGSVWKIAGFTEICWRRQEKQIMLSV